MNESILKKYLKVCFFESNFNYNNDQFRAENYTINSFFASKFSRLNLSEIIFCEEQDKTAWHWWMAKIGIFSLINFFRND